MFSPNGISVILFDLDGTLRHSRPDGADFFMDRAMELGIPLSQDERQRGLRWEHYYWASSPEVRADLKEYGGGTPEFWVNYGRRQLIALGTEAHKAKELAPELAQYMESYYQPDSVVVEDAFGMLDQLKEAGFKLGVVSNRDKPFFEEIDSLKIRHYFDLLLAAGEVESYKPDPGIFSAALERVGVEAGSAMYVGDNYFADVVGARNAGLQPVLYDPRGIYPQAECDVIQALGQLPRLLK